MQNVIMVLSTYYHWQHWWSWCSSLAGTRTTSAKTSSEHLTPTTAELLIFGELLIQPTQMMMTMYWRPIGPEIWWEKRRWMLLLLLIVVFVLRRRWKCHIHGISYLQGVYACSSCDFQGISWGKAQLGFPHVKYISIKFLHVKYISMSISACKILFNHNFRMKNTFQL